MLHILKEIKGLNPCSNGMTIELSRAWLPCKCLISLNPCSNGMTIEYIILTYNYEKKTS